MVEIFKAMSKRNKFRTIWFSMVTIFFIWQWSTYQAKGIEDLIFQTNEVIAIKEDGAKISILNKQASKVEIIFYPGGLVDPKSYIPLGRSLSSLGYSVHIIKMPWRMSTIGYTKIKELFHLNAEDKIYVLGGHSQGAKMAAQFVYENKGLVAGLFLLGTSHPRDINLSSYDIPTLKIYAEFDGLASVAEVYENKNKLPNGSEMKLIVGGNHSQFGYFGNMLMDGKSTINRAQQHEITIKHLDAFLKRINKK